MPATESSTPSIDAILTPSAAGGSRSDPALDFLENQQDQAMGVVVEDMAYWDNLPTRPRSNAMNAGWHSPGDPDGLIARKYQADRSGANDRLAAATPGLVGGFNAQGIKGAMNSANLQKAALKALTAVGDKLLPVPVLSMAAGAMNITLNGEILGKLEAMREYDNLTDEQMKLVQYAIHQKAGNSKNSALGMVPGVGMLNSAAGAVHFLDKKHKGTAGKAREEFAEKVVKGVKNNDSFFMKLSQSLCSYSDEKSARRTNDIKIAPVKTGVAYLKARIAK
jgi:hypothetical protein